MKFARPTIRALCFWVALLPVLIFPGCIDHGNRAKLDDIEHRIKRIEEMFQPLHTPSEHGAEVVTVAPPYEEPTFSRSSVLPEGMDTAEFERRNPEIANMNAVIARNREKYGSGEWDTSAFESRGKLVISRTNMPAAVINGAIYVIGGVGPGRLFETFRSDVERISADGLVKRTKTTMSRRRYHAAEAYHGKIYVMAGEDMGSHSHVGRSPFPDDVEIYTPGVEAISFGARLPSPRYLAASVLLNGKIYLIGGTPPLWTTAHNPDGTTYQVAGLNPPDSEVHIYDIASDKWSRGSAMSVARQCAAVVHDGKIYAIAGYDGKKAVRAFEVYDPQRDKWEKLPDLPFSMSAHRAMAVNDYIFCFGDYELMDRICVYSFSRKKWAVLKMKMTPARQTAIAEMDGNIYVIGGNTASKNRDMPKTLLDAIQVFSIETLKREAILALSHSRR